MQVQAIGDALPQVVSRGGDRREGTTDTSQITFAGDADSNTMSASLKKTHAELRFETRNLVTHGGRREVKLYRRE